jgi:hypothetical protein
VQTEFIDHPAPSSQEFMKLTVEECIKGILTSGGDFMENHNYMPDGVTPVAIYIGVGPAAVNLAKTVEALLDGSILITDRPIAGRHVHTPIERGNTWVQNMADDLS